MLVKKVNDPSLTAEEVQTANENVYKSIFSAGVSSVSSETEQLRKEVADLKKEKSDHAKIRAQASKLGLSAKGEELIEAGSSVEDALTSLIDAKASGEGSEQVELGTAAGFISRTAPKPVGAGNSGTSEFASYEDAVEHFTKEKKMNRRDAAKHIRRNYPELIGG